MSACEHDGLDLVSIALAAHEHVDTACPDCQRPVRVFGTIVPPRHRHRVRPQPAQGRGMSCRNAAGDRARIQREEYDFLRTFGMSHEDILTNLAPRMGVTVGYLHDVIKATDKVPA